MRYIIDGYNLIFRVLDQTWSMKSVSLEESRDQVVPLLWDLFEGTSHEIQIIFDSSPAHFFVESGRRDPPFHLLFSPPPLNADKFILELCHGVQKKGELTVVTSDNHLLLSVKELGIKTQNVEEFLSHFRHRKQKQKREIKPEIPFSAEKLARYRDLFEKRANDPATFEDL